MLKYKIWLPITIVTISFLVIVDFELFKVWPRFEFYFHNVAALVVGTILVIFSYILLNKKPVRQELLYLNLTIGIVMIAIHITKLIIGKCI